MKKAILSPLCSALVIPGLGQILNQHLKKGTFVLCAVFILFISGIIKLYHIISSLIKGHEVNHIGASMIIERLKTQDLSALWYLTLAFLVLWFYSVVDAFVAGRKIDRASEKDAE